jgi:hypothetical protein
LSYNKIKRAVEAPESARHQGKEAASKEVNMKKTLMIGMMTAMVLFVLGAVSFAGQQQDPMTGGAMYTKSAVDLRMDMRKLWEDHITYTRGFIISSIASLEDTGKVAERLLRNQDDIGSAIAPLYGEAAGKKLASLLRDHILIAADIVTAAKAGNNEGVASGQKRWQENADAIATFLSGANPNWSKQTLTNMLYEHLALTTTEVVSRLNKDWAADIAAYDKGHVHMLMFADMLTQGIVKQFPDKFTK